MTKDEQIRMEKQKREMDKRKRERERILQKNRLNGKSEKVVGK